MNEKKCIQCDEKLIGRIDKKFCSDQCRFIFNNSKRQKSKAFQEINEVNKILKKNRNILSTINPEGTSHLKTSTLLSLGYNFRYFTSYYKAKNGNTYFLVYDLGYMYMPEEKIRIINKQTFMDLTKNEIPKL